MTTEDEARMAGIRERAARDRAHADHLCNDVVMTLEHFQANLGALHGVCHLTVTREGAEPVRIATCARPDADEVALLEERELLLAKVDAAEAEVEALKRGFATPSSEASTSEGTHASVPGNAWDVIIRDRDEWKRRAGKAEAFIASIGQDSGVDFHDEIAHLRGEGPDPFAVPEVERWRKRSEAAEKSATDLKEQLNSNEASLDSALKACLAAEAEAGRIRGVMHADAIADWDFCPTCELAYHTPDSATSRCPYCAVRKWEDREIRRASCCDVNEQRAQKAELRLSQVENTIRAAVGRFEAVAREYRDQMFVWDEGGEVLSALHELLVDLGFEPEPGR